MTDTSRVRHFAFPTSFPTIRGDQIAAHEVRINDRIRAREVFLVGPEGEQLGVKPLPEALSYARQLEFDLVEVAPNANPPVCRVMDYGRYVYEQEQRRRQSKRKATNVVIKEMKFRPKIDEHDYTTKMKHVVRFLGEGNKVKLTIMDHCGPLRAVAAVIHGGRQVATAEARIEDEHGKLYAHATTTCFVFDIK